MRGKVSQKLTLRSGNDKVDLALAEEHQRARKLITEKVGLRIKTGQPRGEKRRWKENEPG
jgi:hypothetical protein